MNATAVTGITYTDSSVAAGTIYCYVVKAVDNTGLQSVYSNSMMATIPTP
jgi:fibronectin type 3 domain-containing protein